MLNLSRVQKLCSDLFAVVVFCRRQRRRRRRLARLGWKFYPELKPKFQQRQQQTSKLGLPNGWSSLASNIKASKIPNWLFKSSQKAKDQRYFWFLENFRCQLAILSPNTSFLAWALLETSTRGSTFDGFLQIFRSISRQKFWHPCTSAFLRKFK